MADRLLNYVFAILLIALFVLFADSSERIWIIITLIICSAVALIAFLNNSLTIDGAGAALIVGVFSVGLGSWAGAVLILFLYLGSYMLSWWFGIAEHPFTAVRKEGLQIWANTFWFVLFIAFFFMFDDSWQMVAAGAAMASVISSIWASITIQSLFENAKLITTMQVVPSGTAGAVSLPGMLAAAAGALSVAMLFLIFTFSWDLRAGVVVLVAGFSGCFVDSYLGAIFLVHKTAERWLPDTAKKSKLIWLQRFVPGKDGVHFIAAGIASAIAVLLY